MYVKCTAWGWRKESLKQPFSVKTEGCRKVQGVSGVNSARVRLAACCS